MHSFSPMPLVPTWQKPHQPLNNGGLWRGPVFINLAPLATCNACFLVISDCPSSLTIDETSFFLPPLFYPGHLFEAALVASCCWTSTGTPFSVSDVDLLLTGASTESRRLLAQSRRPAADGFRQCNSSNTPRRSIRTRSHLNPSPASASTTSFHRQRAKQARHGGLAHSSP